MMSCLALELLLFHTGAKIIKLKVTVKIYRLYCNFFHYFFFVFSIKWRISAEHNVENDSTGPYVTFLIIFTLNDFRSKVIRCSNQAFQFLARIKLSGSSEINDLESFAFHIIKHILRLDIPVHDIFFMHVKDCGQDLFHDLGGFFFREYFISLNSMKEVTSFTKLHN